MLFGDSDSVLSQSFVESLKSYKCHINVYSAVLIVAIANIGVAQIEPRHRQFDETDSSISMPLKAQTVPLWLLVLIAGAMPLLIVILLEKTRVRSMHVARICLSLECTLLITDAAKKYVGRPRPNFLAMVEYSQHSMNGTPDRIMEGFQSMPSGHASAAFAGLGYLTFYLAARYRPDGWALLVCILPSIIALFIAFSRIVDYWHNVDDVIAGIFIGSAVAAACFFSPSTQSTAKKARVSPQLYDQVDLDNVESEV